MFGKNSIAHQEFDPYNLAIESSFYTIQGEGPFSGMPALFIRLSGCNLACHFCDTQFEVNLLKKQTVLEFIAGLKNQFTYQQRKFVVITGGEPMRQDLTALISGLYETGTKRIQIETAGTLWQEGLGSWLDQGKLVLVCSPKTPKVDANIMRTCRHWKYIITAGEQSPFDGLPLRGTQTANKDQLQKIYRAEPISEHGFGGNTIWVSPCDSYAAEQNQANMDAARDAALKYGYRLSLQIHKLIGVE